MVNRALSSLPHNRLPGPGTSPPGIMRHSCNSSTAPGSERHCCLETTGKDRLIMVSESLSKVTDMGNREGLRGRPLACLAIGLGLMVSGCVTGTIEPSPDSNLTARDRKLLANPPYAKATIP